MIHKRKIYPWEESLCQAWYGKTKRLCEPTPYKVHLIMQNVCVPLIAQGEAQFTHWSYILYHLEMALVMLLRVVIILTALQLRPAPWASWDSLNRFTIFTQPPYSFAACLVVGHVCSLNPPSVTNYGQIHHWHCHWIHPQVGFDTCPIQHLPAGSRHATWSALS